MRQKKILTIQDILEDAARRTLTKQNFESEYESALKNSRAKQREDNLKTRSRYSLRTHIKNNPWLKTGRPASEAIRWLSKTVFKNPKQFRYPRNIMYIGGLFAFEYKDPKYKDTSVLPYFDKFPLVLSLGPRITQEGPRNLGINLHLLPPRIRIIILCWVFEMYKNSYRYGIFVKKDINPVQITYEDIKHQLHQYGVEFAVRMYIPQRMKEIVHFPLRTWHQAIFIPSRGYYDIRAAQLIKEWRKWCRNNGVMISPNIDWKSKI